MGELGMEELVNCQTRKLAHCKTCKLNFTNKKECLMAGLINVKNAVKYILGKNGKKNNKNRGIIRNDFIYKIYYS